jgi:hypothetical protein
MGRDVSGSGSGRKCSAVRCCAGAVLRWCCSGGSEVWLFGGMGEGRGAGQGASGVVAVVAVVVGRGGLAVGGRRPEATRVGAAARRDEGGGERPGSSSRRKRRWRGLHEHEHEQQSSRAAEEHIPPFRLLPVRAARAPRKNWCRPSGHAQPPPTVRRGGPVDEIPAPVSFIQDSSKYTSNDSGVSTSTTSIKATATAATTTTSWSLQRCPQAQQSSAVATLRAHPGTVLRYIAVFSAQVFTVHVHCSCSLFMFTVHVHCSCSLFMFTAHVHCSVVFATRVSSRASLAAVHCGLDVRTQDSVRERWRGCHESMMICLCETMVEGHTRLPNFHPFIHRCGWSRLRR